MEIKNLLQPENARYIPLVLIGLAKGIGELVMQELQTPPRDVQEQARASVQFYSTFDQEKN